MEDNDFEDWSHPTRIYQSPRRVRWAPTIFVWCVLLGSAALVFWGAWHVGFMIRDAYRVVFE